MIQANELRIGNWVNIEGEFDSKIHSIENGRLWCKDGDQMISSTVFEFQPIPLTPEVLEKCVFRKSMKQPVHYINLRNPAKQLELLKSGEYFYPSIYQAAEVSSDNDGTVYINRIQYLHQLQNLYFALTGEELNYTP